MSRRSTLYPQWKILLFGVLVGLALTGRIVGLAASWRRLQPFQQGDRPNTSVTHPSAKGTRSP